MILEKLSDIPSVNHLNIKDHVNKTVVVLGKVLSFRNNTLFMEVSGDAEIMVKNFNDEVPPQNFIYIVGKVFEDGSLDYIDCVNSGFEEFSFLDINNQLIELLKNKPHLANFI